MPNERPDSAIMSCLAASLFVLCACPPSSSGCSDGGTLCAGRCVALDSTLSSCGACGHACAADETCAAGTCRSTDASLSGLSASVGALTPGFSSEVSSYRLTVPLLTSAIRLTPRARSPRAAITVDGQRVPSGEPSADLARPNLVSTPIYVQVTAEDGVTQRGYRVLPLWRDLQTLSASNPSSGGCFGEVLAVSGDTLVVGEPCPPDGGLLDAGVAPGGTVSAFVRADGAWVFQGNLDPGGLEGYLPGDTPGPLVSFGASVAISGDTVVVGAPLEAPRDLPGPGGQPIDSGAVYVFVRANGVWHRQAHLVPAHPVSGERFGAAVSVFGDLLVVGAPDESGASTGVDGDPADQRASASASGAAFVFNRRGAGWDQQAYLKASNTGRGDSLGASVAASRELVAVGAPGEASSATGIDGDQSSDGAPGSGAAYAFGRAGGAWSQVAYLKASNTDRGDAFGTAVAMQGSFLAVGAPGEASAATGIDGDQTDNSQPRAGAVYLFEWADIGWFQAGYVKAGNPHLPFDAFGSSVALAGPHLAIGAPHEQSPQIGVVGHSPSSGRAVFGAAYLFTASSAQWQQRGWIKPPDPRSTCGPLVAVSTDGALLLQGTTAAHQGVVYAY